MDRLKPRHWAQFRLSSWLVVVTILGWCISERPFLVSYWRPTHPRLNESHYEDYFPEWVLETRDELNRTAIPGVHFRLDPDGDGWLTEFAPNPGLRLPLLAVVSFFAWTVWHRRSKLRIDGLCGAKKSVS